MAPSVGRVLVSRHSCCLSIIHPYLLAMRKSLLKLREIKKKQHGKPYAQMFRVGANPKRFLPGKTEIHKWFHHTCFLVCGAFGCDSCGFEQAAQPFLFFHACSTNPWKIWQTLVLNKRGSRPTCSIMQGEYRSFLRAF